MITRHPYKCKRRSKKNAPLHEDDDAAIGTVTHVEVQVNTKHRPKTKCIKVPLTAGMEEQSSLTPGIHDNPDPVPDYNMQEPQQAEGLSWPHIGMVRSSP
jgi:hypothetical protein